MIWRETMTQQPPITDDPARLEDAAFAAPRVPSPIQRIGPYRLAAVVLLVLLLGLLAAAVFLAITVGVTLLVGNLLPRPVNLAAPIAGVGVAALCFGGASRFRKGMLKNRYGLFRRPPRELGADLAGELIPSFPGRQRRGPEGPRAAVTSTSRRAARSA